MFLRDGPNRIHWIAGFLAVATQRVGLHVGGAAELQGSVLVLAVYFGYLTVSGIVAFSRLGLLLFGGLAISTTVSFFTSTADYFPGGQFSVFSLLLLLAVYYPVVLDAARDEGRRIRPIGQAFFAGYLTAIAVGAVLAVVQFVAQAAGLGYWDFFQRVPARLMMSGFNSYYSLEYVSGAAGQFKPNGMLFLEPSALSLFTGIGLVAVLTRIFVEGTIPRGGLRIAFVWFLVLAGGFAVSGSTSGLLVLAFGIVPILFQLRRNGWLLVPVLAVTVVAWQLGAFAAVISKSTESRTGDTSTNLRLNMPYTTFTPYWLERPWFGFGAGVSTDIVEATGIPGLQVSTTMKALVEYGLMGALAVAAIIAASILRNRAPLPLLIAVVAAWLLPAESLLNGYIVALIVFAFPNWTWRPREVVGADAVRSVATQSLRSPPASGGTRLPPSSDGASAV